MTGIDTAAIRALEAVHYRGKGFVLIRDYERDALCDGYDEAQRLRRWKDEAAEVLIAWEAAYDALGRPGRLGDVKSAAAIAEAQRLTAARQALADFAADLRALADRAERNFGGPTAWVHLGSLRAVIDRHAPEGGR